MSNMPHGRVGHISLNCDDCTELKTHDDDVVVIDDPELGRVEMLYGEHSLVATNGHFGGWTKQRDGTLVSVYSAKT